MAGLYPAYYAAAAGDPPESMSPIGVVPTQERDDEMELHELEPPHIEEQHQETPVQNDHETVELHEIDNFEHGAAPASQPAPAAAPAASPARSPPPAHTKHHHHQHHHHTQHHHGHHKHHAPEKATPSPANAQPAQAQAEGPVRWGAPRTDDFQDIEAASQPAVYIPPKSTATTTVNPDPGADMFYGGKHTPSRPTYSSHKVDNGPNATLHIVLSCIAIWCCGCICGLIAYAYAVQLKDKKEHGEIRKAEKYALYSKIFMVLSVITFGVTLAVLFLVPRRY